MEYPDYYTQFLESIRCHDKFPSDSNYKRLKRIVKLPKGEVLHGVSATKKANVQKKLMLDFKDGEGVLMCKLSGKRILKQSEFFDAMKQFHENSGHPGRDITHRKLQDVYACVPRELVAEFIKRCDTCCDRRPKPVIGVRTYYATSSAEKVSIAGDDGVVSRTQKDIFGLDDDLFPAAVEDHFVSCTEDDISSQIIGTQNIFIPNYFPENDNSDLLFKEDICGSFVQESECCICQKNLVYDKKGKFKCKLEHCESYQKYMKSEILSVPLGNILKWGHRSRKGKNIHSLFCFQCFESAEQLLFVHQQLDRLETLLQKILKSIKSKILKTAKRPKVGSMKDQDINAFVSYQNGSRDISSLLNENATTCEIPKEEDQFTETQDNFSDEVDEFLNCNENEDFGVSNSNEGETIGEKRSIPIGSCEAIIDQRFRTRSSNKAPTNNDIVKESSPIVDYLGEINKQLEIGNDCRTTKITFAVDNDDHCAVKKEKDDVPVEFGDNYGNDNETEDSQSNHSNDSDYSIGSSNDSENINNKHRSSGGKGKVFRSNMSVESIRKNLPKMNRSEGKYRNRCASNCIENEGPKFISPLKRQKKVHECDVCKSILPTKKRLRIHLKTHEIFLYYECEICWAYKTKSNKSFKDHMRKHTGEKPYKCPTCDECFRTRSNRDIHSQVHIVECNFSCENCGKSFKMLRQLRAHQKTHIRDEHVCKDCGKSFENKARVGIHYRRVHSGQRYICEECGSSFSQRHGLTLHIRRLHKNELVFECGICGKHLSSAVRKQTHMRTHTGEKPFVCQVETCGARYGNKDSFDAHVRSHTGEKFHCNVCGKEFIRKQYLTWHLRTHSGKKPAKRKLVKESDIVLAENASENVTATPYIPTAVQSVDVVDAGQLQN